MRAQAKPWEDLNTVALFQPVGASKSDHECQPTLGTGKKRVDRQLPVALLYLVSHSPHELGIALVEPSG